MLFKNTNFFFLFLDGFCGCNPLKTLTRQNSSSRGNLEFKDLFRGSSTLALRPRLQHYENFSPKTDPTGSLGAATPTTQPLERL